MSWWLSGERKLDRNSGPRDSFNPSAQGGHAWTPRRMQARILPSSGPRVVCRHVSGRWLRRSRPRPPGEPPDRGRITAGRPSPPLPDRLPQPASSPTPRPTAPRRRTPPARAADARHITPKIPRGPGGNHFPRLLRFHHAAPILPQRRRNRVSSHHKRFLWQFVCRHTNSRIMRHIPIHFRSGCAAIRHIARETSRYMTPNPRNESLYAPLAFLMAHIAAHFGRKTRERTHRIDDRTRGIDDRTRLARERTRFLRSNPSGQDAAGGG
jgi:hypothetical protein